MAHPYTTTLQGLKEALLQLRTTFPPSVTADTLKKWSVAPNNEGTVLAVLRFLNIIDDEGKKQGDAAKVFVEHQDDAFSSKFADLVRASYPVLFRDWGDKAWELSRDQLIAFFRTEDHSSARIGKQQAATFELLAQFAGQGPALPEATTTIRKKRSTTKASGQKKEKTEPSTNEVGASSDPPPARVKTGTPTFTVRVEINLPVAEDQEVYDRIFKSIKENLYP